MGNISSIFGGDFLPPEQAGPDTPPDTQFMEAIMEQGYQVPDSIVFDGLVHRFSTTGKKRDDSGWYVAYSGAICAGAFGDWREGSSIQWRQNIGRELSAIEQMEHANRIKRARELAQQQREQRQEIAADTCAAIWEQATEAHDNHPYLQTKGVQSHGLRVTGDGRLIIPRFDSSGEIISLQYIGADGEKRFHSGGKAKDAFYVLGALSGATSVYIAEGYATAASIYEATGCPVYIAFSAGNLQGVSVIARQYHTGDLCIVADNDESQTGITKAREAASQSGARVVMPPMLGDANDYASAGGDLVELIAKQEAESWLISAADFAGKPKPIKWLIKKVLPRESLIMVHGPSGGGKTFVVLDMAMRIASGGGEWMGRQCKAGTVVYLAGEGHAGLAGRIKAWQQHNNAQDLSMYISRSGTDLNTPEGYHKTIDAISMLPEPPALLVVDTLHRFLAGDENKAQDAKTMLDACGELQRKYGCAVLLVHHTGVTDEAQHRARGSSAWRGALESEFSVVPSDGAKPIEIIQRKNKDAELIEPIAAELESVFLDGWFEDEEDGGEQISSAVLVPSDKSPQSVLSVADQQTEKFKQWFIDAWNDSGCEHQKGCKYVSNAALKHYLTTAQNHTPATAKKHASQGQGDKKMMSRLQEKEVARREGNGWILLQTPDEAVSAIIGI